ncbi:hypothetical protein ACROYT_G008126 [Oculina patagonica]
MEAGRPEESASARPEHVPPEDIRTAVLPLEPQVSQEAVSAASSLAAVSQRLEYLQRPLLPLLRSRRQFYLHLQQAQDRLAGVSDIVKLQKDLEDLKKASDLSLVENAITYLRQLISRPAAVFDPFATMAALEQVVNVAREKGDDRASKYLVILRQCRPLTNSNALRSILTKLVASKEEAESKRL